MELGQQQEVGQQCQSAMIISSIYTIIVIVCTLTTPHRTNTDGEHRIWPEYVSFSVWEHLRCVCVCWPRLMWGAYETPSEPIKDNGTVAWRRRRLSHCAFQLVFLIWALHECHKIHHISNTRASPHQQVSWGHIHIGYFFLFLFSNTKRDVYRCLTYVQSRSLTAFTLFLHANHTYQHMMILNSARIAAIDYVILHNMVVMGSVCLLMQTIQQALTIIIQSAIE